MRKQEINQLAKLVEEAANLRRSIYFKYLKNYEKKDKIVLSRKIKVLLIVGGVPGFLALGAAVIAGAGPLVATLASVAATSVFMSAIVNVYFIKHARGERREMTQELEEEAYRDFVLASDTKDYEKYVEAHKKIVPFLEKIKSSMFEEKLSKKNMLEDRTRLGFLLHNIRNMYSDSDGLFEEFTGLEDTGIAIEDIPKLDFSAENLSKEEFNSILENKEELQFLLKNTYNPADLASLFMTSNVIFSKTLMEQFAAYANSLEPYIGNDIPIKIEKMIVCLAKNKFDFTEEEKFNIVEFVKNNTNEESYLKFLENACVASRDNSWRKIAIEEYTERKNRLAKEKALLPTSPASELEKEVVPINTVELLNMEKTAESPENTFAVSLDAFMKNVASFAVSLNSAEEGIPHVDQIGQNLLKNIQIIENNKDFLSSEDKIKYSILTGDNFKEIQDLWRRSQGTRQETVIRTKLFKTLGTIETQLEQIAQGVESSLTQKINAFALYQENKTPPKQMKMGK